MASALGHTIKLQPRHTCSLECKQMKARNWQMHLPVSVVAGRSHAQALASASASNRWGPRAATAHAELHRADSASRDVRESVCQLGTPPLCVPHGVDIHLQCKACAACKGQVSLQPHKSQDTAQRARPHSAVEGRALHIMQGEAFLGHRSDKVLHNMQGQVSSEILTVRPVGAGAVSQWRQTHSRQDREALSALVASLAARTAPLGQGC